MIELAGKLVGQVLDGPWVVEMSILPYPSKIMDWAKLNFKLDSQELSKVLIKATSLIKAKITKSLDFKISLQLLKLHIIPVDMAALVSQLVNSSDHPIFNSKIIKISI